MRQADFRVCLAFCCLILLHAAVPKPAKRGTLRLRLLCPLIQPDDRVRVWRNIQREMFAYAVQRGMNALRLFWRSRRVDGFQFTAQCPYIGVGRDIVKARQGDGQGLRCVADVDDVQHKGFAVFAARGRYIYVRTRASADIL